MKEDTKKQFKQIWHSLKTEVKRYLKEGTIVNTDLLYEQTGRKNIFPENWLGGDNFNHEELNKQLGIK